MTPEVETPDAPVATPVDPESSLEQVDTEPEPGSEPKTEVVAEATPAVSGEVVDEEEDEEENVLDLTSIGKRKKIKLPVGEEDPETGEQPTEIFEMRLLDDFGIARQQQLLYWSRNFEKLWNAEEALGEDEQKKLQFYLQKLFHAVLLAPREKRDQIDDGSRGRVVTAFSLAPFIAQQEAQAKLLKEAARKEEEKKAKVKEDVDDLTSES